MSGICSRGICLTGIIFLTIDLSVSSSKTQIMYSKWLVMSGEPGVGGPQQSRLRKLLALGQMKLKTPVLGVSQRGAR